LSDINQTVTNCRLAARGFNPPNSM